MMGSTTGKEAELPPMFVVRAVNFVTSLLAKTRRALTPPPLTLLELGSASFFISNALRAAARLGIADSLTTRPKTAEDIAREVGASPDALNRLMRALAAAGVFRRLPDGCYALNPVSQGLVTDAPG